MNIYLNSMTKLSTFPFAERKLKIGMEYGKLIRRFVEGKAFLKLIIFWMHIMR